MGKSTAAVGGSSSTKVFPLRRISSTNSSSTTTTSSSASGHTSTSGGAANQTLTQFQFASERERIEFEQVMQEARQRRLARRRGSLDSATQQQKRSSKPVDFQALRKATESSIHDNQRCLQLTIGGGVVVCTTDNPNSMPNFNFQ